ncbi:MAG: UvrD-helicase domain-containing protein, partial [Bacteroidaceae bacterium]|nr:UvrD-helicase domain-containing protein [Bacteroidaceae bacterium]
MKPLRIYKASAGSGKTLAVEYIALLAINPLEYQNILAVTFTNKATTEMKQRILSTLYAIAHGLPSADGYVENILANLKARQDSPQYQEEPWLSALAEMNRSTLQARAKEALENIIHDYSRFHIETIDSFFQSIVREIANELELSVKMKVELDETEVLSDAVDQIVCNLKEGSREFRTIIGFIEEKIRENHSWQVEEMVKEFGRNIFKENYLIHGETVRKKITDFGVISQYRSIINAFLVQKKEAVITLGKRLRAAYDDSGMTEKDGGKTIVSFIDKVYSYTITEPSNQSRGTFSDTIKEYTTNADKWFKKTSKNRSSLQPSVENLLVPMLRQLFELHDEYVAHLHTVTAIGQHLYSLMLLNKISSTIKTLNESGNRFLLPETANFLRNVINNQDIPFIYEKTGAVIKH